MSSALGRVLMSGMLAPLGLLHGSTFAMWINKETRVLSREKRTALKLKVSDLAQKLGIFKPVEIIEKKGQFGLLAARGSLVCGGRVGIVVYGQDLEVLPEGQQEFLLLHELSHIKDSDTLMPFLKAGFIGLISCLAFAIFFPSFDEVGKIILTMNISVISALFWLRRSEEKSDKVALSFCVDKGAGAAFFESLRLRHVEQRNASNVSWLQHKICQMTITPAGNVWLDPVHPFFTTRIAYLSEKSS